MTTEREENEKGELSIPFDLSMNDIIITINDKEVRAKVDSGADLNFVSKSFLDSLPAYLTRKFVKKMGTCTVANNQEIKMLGDVTLTYCIIQNVGLWVSALLHCLWGLSLPQHSSASPFQGAKSNLSPEDKIQDTHMSVYKHNLQRQPEIRITRAARKKAAEEEQGQKKNPLTPRVRGPDGPSLKAQSLTQRVHYTRARGRTNDLLSAISVLGLSPL